MEPTELVHQVWLKGLFLVWFCSHGCFTFMYHFFVTIYRKNNNSNNEATDISFKVLDIFQDNVFSGLCLLGVMIILKNQFASIYIHLLFICIFSMYVCVPVCLCGCLIIYSSTTWALWTTNVDAWWAISSTSTITSALLSYPFVFCLYTND